MKGPTRTALLFSLGTLIGSAVLMQTIYTLVIRPRAAEVLSRPVEVRPGEGIARNLRSPWVILKDVEQQTCITVALWSLCLLGFQSYRTSRSRRLLEKRYLSVSEGHVLLPEDAREASRAIESLPEPERDEFLPRTLIVALNRFGATRSVQDAAESVRDECDLEMARLDAQLSMVRFTAWAIPAIGFVGTVRGIGVALQEAQGAMRGDISGVTLGLGITFNATLVALALCIIVMFWLHQVQQSQDELVLDTRNYVDRKLIRHMRVHLMRGASSAAA